MKPLSFIIALMLLFIPFAQAQEFENSQHEITKVVHIYRGKGDIMLNLSNPQDVQKYAPVEQFWDENLTGPGKILDGILPPDILYLNSTSFSLAWNFSISSDIIANGASQFILRLPVSFDASSPNFLNLKLSAGDNIVCEYSTTSNNLDLKTYVYSSSQYYTTFNTTESYITLRTFNFGYPFNQTYTWHLIADDTGAEWYNYASAYEIVLCLPQGYGNNFTWYVEANGERSNEVHIHNISAPNTPVTIHKADLGIYDMKLNYANLTLHLWYVNLSGFIFPAENYKLELSFSDVKNPAILVYSYDYLYDNITGFYLNDAKYSGDLAVGFAFKQLSSNGISSLYIDKECSYTVNLDKSYSGDYYVSFAWEVYAPQSQNLTVTFSANTENSTTLSLAKGLSTIRGNLLLNLSGNTLEVTFSSDKPFYFLIEGISKDVLDLGFFKIYTQLYGDLVVNEEEYYLPGVIVLPGSWMQSMALALKYAPPALLRVILVQAVYHTTIYTFLKIEAAYSYLLYKGMDFIGGLINDLLNQSLHTLFNWTYTTVVHWIVSDASWWLWAFLKGAWFLLQIGIYVLAVWITDSFLRGIVALPDRGVNGMLDEWSGVTSFVESIASKFRRRLR